MDTVKKCTKEWKKHQHYRLEWSVWGRPNLNFWNWV